jgi:hypothetical protein
MQNTVKTVDTMPTLPSELDIVVLRPFDPVIEGGDSRYQRQFQADFRVRRSHVLARPCYLKAIHPDYQYITISPQRFNTLLTDSNVSSIVSVIDGSDIAEEPHEPCQPVTDELPLRIPVDGPKSQYYSY